MGVAKLTDQNTIVPAESKYARIERERRYLLQDLPEGLTRASPHVQITDNYITGTRLRLQESARSANEQVDGEVDAEVCSQSGKIFRARSSPTFISTHWKPKRSQSRTQRDSQESLPV